MVPEQNTVKNAVARCEATEQVIPALLGCATGEETFQVPAAQATPGTGASPPPRGAGLALPRWETIGTDSFRACRMPDNKGSSLCSSGGAARLWCRGLVGSVATVVRWDC